MAPQDENRTADSSPVAASERVAKDVRAVRLAAALRDNLRRRKALARGRRADAHTGADSAQQGGESADDTKP
ncbi:MAG: hypothetical protein K2Y29_09605 [Beijerinckiaceae bacterium]|nr:hypothetical protein [Beijerinckiaceae bacterium]